MDTLALFREGRVLDALACQQRLVHSEPANSEARLLLAEFLLFDGQFTEVRSQLEQLPRDVPGMDDFLQEYDCLVSAEMKRQGLHPEWQPLFLEPPPHSCELRRQALDALKADAIPKAVELLDAAGGSSPGLPGHVDGREFDDVRDLDDLLATVLEILIDDQYLWFPFESIAKLRIRDPESLRDYYFVPAELTAKTGKTWSVYLPSIYTGSFHSADVHVRSGHQTDWTADKDGPTRGLGMRLFQFGEEELSLFDFTQWEG